jgi:hypothetical protein
LVRLAVETFAVRAGAISSLVVTTIVLVHELVIIAAAVVRMVVRIVVGMRLLMHIRLSLAIGTRCWLLVLAGRIGGVLPTVVGIARGARSEAIAALGVLAEIVVVRGVVGAKSVLRVGSVVVGLAALLAVVLTIVVAVRVPTLLIGSIIR